MLSCSPGGAVAAPTYGSVFHFRSHLESLTSNGVCNLSMGSCPGALFADAGGEGLFFGAGDATVKSQGYATMCSHWVGAESSLENAVSPSQCLALRNFILPWRFLGLHWPGLFFDGLDAIQTGKMVRDVLLLQHQLGRSLQLEGVDCSADEEAAGCSLLGWHGLDIFGSLRLRSMGNGTPVRAGDALDRLSIRVHHHHLDPFS